MAFGVVGDGTPGLGGAGGRMGGRRWVRRADGEAWRSASLPREPCGEASGIASESVYRGCWMHLFEDIASEIQIESDLAILLELLLAARSCLDITSETKYMFD